MLSKTLATLIERAERKGTAVKRVREGAIIGNGQTSGLNRFDYNRFLKQSPMVEQWRVTIGRTEQDGTKYENVIVDHYGTEIAFIERNMTKGTARLVNYYGESNSDRDALNGLCDYYGIDAGFRYRPSVDKFELVG